MFGFSKALTFFPERNTNVLIYVKRRLGMCARKLGKLKEAAKIFRDVRDTLAILAASQSALEHLSFVLESWSKSFP